MVALVSDATIMWRRLQGSVQQQAVGATPTIPSARPQGSMPTLKMPTGTMQRAAAVGVSPNRITLLRDADGELRRVHRDTRLTPVADWFGNAHTSLRPLVKIRCELGKHLRARARLGDCIRRVHHPETTMKLNARNALVPVFSAAALVLSAGTACLIISRSAEATPQFASETGKACGQCHESATGGGKLTAFGQAFKANGNKLP